MKVPIFTPLINSCLPRAWFFLRGWGFLLVLFWGHIWCCSGHTWSLHVGITLKVLGRPYEVLGVEPRLAKCKAGVIPIVYEWLSPCRRAFEFSIADQIVIPWLLFIQLLLLSLFSWTVLILQLIAFCPQCQIVEESLKFLLSPRHFLSPLQRKCNHRALGPPTSESKVGGTLAAAPPCHT